METFGGFLKVFIRRYWFSIGVPSTIATCTLLSVARINVPNWVSLCILVVALVVIRFWVVAEHEKQIARLENELSETQNVRLGAEKLRAQLFARFEPRYRLVGALPDSQVLQLESDETFEVDVMDYLTEDGVKVGSRPVAQSGNLIEIPIDEKALSEVQRSGPWLSKYNGSARVVLQLRIGQNGLWKQYSIATIVRPLFQTSDEYVPGQQDARGGNADLRDVRQGAHSQSAQGSSPDTRQLA